MISDFSHRYIGSFMVCVSYDVLEDGLWPCQRNSSPKHVNKTAWHVCVAAPLATRDVSRPAWRSGSGHW